MAKKNCPLNKGLIFQSEQSGQYANKKFTNYLDSFGVTPSISRKGNYWENAVAESFFKSLKAEIIYGNLLTSRAQMERQVFEYIELWYNKKRRHSHLEYLTIEEFNQIRHCKKVA